MNQPIKAVITSYRLNYSNFSTNFICTLQDEKTANKSTREVTVSFSLSALRQRYTQQCDGSDSSIQCPKFRAKIAPDQNGTAENELKQSIWLVKEDSGNSKVNIGTKFLS